MEIWMMDAVFKALADPSRRHLLDALNRRSGQTLREMCGVLDTTRQAVTKHLAVLEAAGLVTTTRRGREKLHYLNVAPINDIADRWIRQYDRGRAQALADLKKALEEPHMSQTEFVYQTYIRTTPAKLWQALTEPAFIARYFDGGGPRSDFQAGSPVLWKMGADDGPHDWDQRVLISEPYRTLSYSWHNYQPEMRQFFGWTGDYLAELRKEKISKVTFEIEQTTPAAVKLTVTHDDFEPDSEMLRGVREGWIGSCPISNPCSKRDGRYPRSGRRRKRQLRPEIPRGCGGAPSGSPSAASRWRACRAGHITSNSPSLAPSTNASHSAGVKIRVSESMGFSELRMAT
ncbi:MAG TPA: metalloregulator ArsR/SmtB family transcription factor [Pseudonocardiaceae bacterium]|nr:metalloregulator ArsR/SmtB family transcription factor [Pseudonocardiaceae bacterium]